MSLHFCFAHRLKPYHHHSAHPSQRGRRIDGKFTSLGLQCLSGQLSRFQDTEEAQEGVKYHVGSAKSYHFVGVVVTSLVDRDGERNEEEKTNSGVEAGS